MGHGEASAILQRAPPLRHPAARRATPALPGVGAGSCLATPSTPAGGDHAHSVWDNCDRSPSSRSSPARPSSSRRSTPPAASSTRGSQAADVAGLDFAASTPSPARCSSRARSPATCSLSRSSSCARATGAGRRSSPASACWPTTSPTVAADLRGRRRRRARPLRRRRHAALRAVPGHDRRRPAEPGEHSVVPPRRWGGNLDIKHLQRRQTLCLPVGVDGALFSVGDTHAAMGTARSAAPPSRPRWTSPCASTCGATATCPPRSTRCRRAARAHRGVRLPRLHRHPDDLMEAARDATRAAVDHIARRPERSPGGLRARLGRRRPSHPRGRRRAQLGRRLLHPRGAAELGPRRVGDEHGDRRVVQHVVADAAHQRAHATEAAGAEDDRVVVAGCRFGRRRSRARPCRGGTACVTGMSSGIRSTARAASACASASTSS